MRHCFDDVKWLNQFSSGVSNIGTGIKQKKTNVENKKRIFFFRFCGLENDLERCGLSPNKNTYADKITNTKYIFCGLENDLERCGPSSPHLAVNGGAAGPVSAGKAMTWPRLPQIQIKLQLQKIPQIQSTNTNTD